MKQRLIVLILAWSVVAWSPSFAQTIRGRVLYYGSEGVPRVALSLVRRGRSTVMFVSPDRVTTTTEADGSFSIEGIDPTRKWTLVVWDPYREGQIATRVDVDDPNTEIVIRLRKQLHFTEPDVYAYLRGPTVLVRWTPLSGAAEYRLTVANADYRTVAVLKPTASEAEVTLPPGQYYRLSVSAYESTGVEIGANIVYEGSVFAIGVADSTIEETLTPATGQCVLQGERPQLRIAPVKSTRTEAPFMVSSGDAAKLLATYADWYKVELTTGYFPGNIGWIHAADIDCSVP